MDVGLSDPDQRGRLIAAAVEAREDGDVEESARLFEAILARYPNDPDAILQYVHTLRKLRRAEDADLILSQAVAANQENPKLLHLWADLPSHKHDHDKVIERGAVYRDLFPPPLFPDGWHNLAMCMGALVESLRWDRLQTALEAMRDDVLRYPQALRIGLSHANELGLTSYIQDVIDAARPEAWANLPRETKGNAQLRVKMSLLNRRLIDMVGARVVPLGQNCLPYLLSGRWGLVPERGRGDAMTPFDRGAFQRNCAATVIATDFEGFDDPAAYEITNSYDGKRMYRHQATQIYFFHERGEYWLRDDGASFFAHLSGMLASWQRISQTGRRIFFFCLCGQGDLEMLIEVMERRLLGPDARLLILDVLQQPHACPRHERVHYVHLPYLPGYKWDDFTHQSGPQGVGFELSVVKSIAEMLTGWLSEDEAAAFNDQRRRLLLDAAAASSARGEHDNALALHEAARGEQASAGRAAIAYALALRNTGKIAEAQAVLAEAKAREPRSYDAHAAWAEYGVAPFDWNTRLLRLRGLRRAFPPETEPRSWPTLVEELRLCTEFGQWDEAVALIDSRWHDFTTRPDLFSGALDALLLLGLLTTARRLLDEATPAAQAAVPRPTLDLALARLDQARTNKLLLLKCNAQVIPLGQNGLPALLAARWGLRGTVRTYNGSTPFEFGDFYRDNVADAITDDFASLLKRQDFAEKPAWGGGKLLRHVVSDVAFMVHRNATIGPAEQDRFFIHIEHMIAHWREVKDVGRRVFLHFRFDKNDVGRLVSVAKERLLQGQDAHLVIIDLNADPAVLPPDQQVTLLHAPLPKNYMWFNALGSATTEGVAYDQQVLAPVLDILNQYDPQAPA